jgi:hypothetical protein
MKPEGLIESLLKAQRGAQRKCRCDMPGRDTANRFVAHQSA